MNLKAISARDADVQSAIDQVFSSGGGNVEMPGESGVEWTVGIDLKPGVNLFGDGQTHIVDSVPKDGTGMSVALRCQVQNGWEMAGFTFEGNTPDNSGMNKGHMVFSGVTGKVRAHHIKIRNHKTSILKTYGAVLGLIDHWDVETPQALSYIGVDHSGLFGGKYGDKSWITPLGLGSFDALYFEDCSFRCSNPNQIWGPIDNWGGGRVVIRKNKFFNCVIGSHGTETGGRTRGMLYYEAYDNEFDFSADAQGINLVPIDKIFEMRSGTGVFFRNTVFHAFRRCGFNHLIRTVYKRDDEAISIWGKADGQNSYDKNENGVCVRGLDQPGTSTSRDLQGKDTPDPGWFGNVDDPIHEWGNNLSDTPQWGVISGSSHVLEGVHFKVNTPRPGYTEAPYPHPLETGTPVPPDPTDPPIPTPPNKPPLITMSFDPPLLAGNVVQAKTNQKIILKMADDAGVVWTELYIGTQKVWEGDEVGQKTYMWNPRPHAGKKPVACKAVTRDAEGFTATDEKVLVVKK